MTALAQRKQKIETKTTFEDFPAYVAARDRLNEMRLEKQRLDRVIQAKNTAIAEAAAQNSESAVDDYIATGKFDDATAKTTQEAIEEAYRRMRIVDAALEQQERTIAALRLECSREICEREKREYEEIVAEVTAAIRALDAAIHRERAFRDSLNDRDVSFSGWIPPIANHSLWQFFAGDPKRRDGIDTSGVAYYLRGVARDYPDAA